jgi:hypothetical protein
MAFFNPKNELTYAMPQTDPPNSVTFHPPTPVRTRLATMKVTPLSDRNAHAANVPQTPLSPSAAAAEPAPVRADAAQWCAQSGQTLRTDIAKLMCTGLGVVVGFVGGVAVTATSSAASYWIAVGLIGGGVVGYFVPTVLATCCFGISDALTPASPSSPTVSAPGSPPGSPGRHIPRVIA